MSASAVCGWRPAAGNLSCPASRHAARISNPAQSLVPVTGLVNRTNDLHTRIWRWQQKPKQCPTRAADVKQSWRAQDADTLKATSINESQFEAEVLQSKLPVLVDFWATWCGPCRLMGLTLDWAAQEYEGKIKCVKIETDLNEGLVDKYKVYGLPTLILFVNGQALPNSQREGALNKEKLKAYIESNLPALAPTTS